MQEQRITVAVRVRPSVGEERYAPSCVRRADDGETITITSDDSAAGYAAPMSFHVDCVFDEFDDQCAVYEECVQELVDHALSGSNATVFTYGQTGSGKTYTILGASQATATTRSTGDADAARPPATTAVAAVGAEAGVFVRVFHDLFTYRDAVAARARVLVALSAVELYLDDVMDLLANKRKLRLRETPEEMLPIGARVVQVHTMDDVRRCFDVANAFRATASTRMNDSSSRSHALFFLDVYQLPVSAVAALATPASDTTGDTTAATVTVEQLVNEYGQLSTSAAAAGVTRARITLADLAGSERVKRSGAAGQAMSEAQAINKSLATLGTVIHAMYTQSAHVPFRESNLTKLLKSALMDASARLLLIGQVAPPPSSATESLSTLRFCHRVKELRAPLVDGDGGNGFADAASAARYADTLREHDALTSEMRLVAVAHAHTPQRVRAVAAEAGVGIAEAMTAIVQRLRDADAVNAAARAEEAAARRREAEAAAARDADVAAFVRHMNELIDEYERVAQAAKAAKKDAKRVAEQQTATHEATLRAAKDAKKERKAAEARVAELRAQLDAAAAEEAAVTTALQQEQQLLLQLQQQGEKARVARPRDDRGAPDDVAAPHEADDAALHEALSSFVTQASELNRLHVQYITRLAATARQRAQVRRMKLLSSALVTEGTLLPDLLRFLVDRAVAVAERQVSAQSPWSWADVDGCSRQLLRADEMYPPMLPTRAACADTTTAAKNNSSSSDGSGERRTRGGDGDVVYHAVTFLSSDDSDDENSHHAAESRRQRRLRTRDAQQQQSHSSRQQADESDSDEHDEYSQPRDDDDDDNDDDDKINKWKQKARGSSATQANTAASSSSSAPRAVAMSGAAVSVVSVSTVVPQVPLREGGGDAAMAFDGSTADEAERSAAATAAAAAAAASSSVHVVDAWRSAANSSVDATATTTTMSDAAAATLHADKDRQDEQQQQQHERRHKRRHTRQHHSHRASQSGNGESANDANNNNDNDKDGGEGDDKHKEHIVAGSRSGSQHEHGEQQQQQLRVDGTGDNTDNGANVPAAAADAAQQQPSSSSHRRHRRRRSHRNDGNSNHVNEHDGAADGGVASTHSASSHSSRSSSSSSTSTSADAASGGGGSSSSVDEQGRPRRRGSGERRDAHADIHYLMSVYDSPTLVHDLIKFLRGGTVMLKHGRSGKPHPRLFWVSTSSTHKELMWTTPNGRSTERAAIDLSLVSYIQLGCFSKVFKRHPLYPNDPAFFRCFTLGLKNGGRTVDIVADSLPDYEAWVVGLAHLIGVDPDWGGKLDITKDPCFEQLTFFESNLCESNFIAPEQYVTLKRAVQQHALRTLDALQECGNDARKAHKLLGGIHLPAVNERGAVYMTKGELRFLAPGVTLDIFRISRIWILMQQMNLVYDDNFVPATTFGVTRR